jgi:uncharacterized repeat protein (TIGR02543 family)
MRRISILSTSLVTSFALALSGLAVSPANAVDSVVQVSCGTETFTVTTVGSDVTVSEGGACTGAVAIPEGVTAIGDYAFGGAAGLASITLPETLNQFGNSPFYGTAGLTQINVSSTNTKFTSVEGVLFGLDATDATLIAYPANRDSNTYTTPTSVLFPNAINAAVTTIRAYAFQRAQKLETLTVSEGVTTLGDGFADSASLLLVINLPETLNQVGTSPFYGTGILMEINVASNNPVFTSVDGVLFGRNGINAKLIAYPANRDSSTYTTPTSVLFPNAINAAVTSINTYAFQKAQKLETLNISEGVTTLGGGIAESTRLLSVINLPATYTAMIGQPFGDAYGLTSITIQASVVSIASRTFINARSLSNIYFLGNEPRLGDEPGVDNDAFSGIASGAKAYVKMDANGFDLDVITGKWKGLTVVDLAPNGDYVCSTGSQTTAETPSLTPRYKITGGVVSDGSSCAGTVLLPDGIKAIGNSAFETATLTSINIPAGVISIGDYAFFNTTDLTSFTVAADNPNYSVNDGVLLNKAGTTLLLYPVGKTATSYLIPSGVTSIGDWAFYQENSLNSITIPEGVVTIGNHSFRNLSALTSITLPATLGSIGEYAFSFATALTSIIIPANVATIGSNAFEYAVALSNIYFLGDAPTVGPDAFANIATPPKAYVNAASASSFTIGDDGKWNGLTVVDLAPDGTYDCSTGAVTASTTNIFSILGGVVTGGTCTGPMVIPSGVVAIGPYAFQEQTTLTSITFSGTSNLKSIGGNAFFGATGLTSVVIPAGVTSIGDTAFYGTSSLTSVTFEGNDTSPPLNIEYGAFYNAIKLTTISIPKNVTSIGNNAFDTTTSLTSVTFAEGSLLTSIGNSAFAYAPKLTSITIPENVESIGTNAFEAATSLASVYFSGNAPTVGADAFLGISTDPKAYIKPTASGFILDEITGKWNGLTVITMYTYTLTYTYNSATGGNTVASSSFVTGDTAITLPTPTRTGYTFAGWYSDAGFTTRIGDAGAEYSPTGNNPALNAYAKWTEVPVLPEPPPSGNPPSGNPPADNTPPVDLVAQAAAADLAARTIKVKSKFAGKALASRVGVKMVSPKAKVTFKISKASKKICTKSGSKIKTLKAGNCVVTFTVQEPKPKKGKKPKATKTVKTLVVN